MFLFPFTGLAELPSVDDVSIQDEFVAAVMAEEMEQFPNPGIPDTKMDV